MLEKLLVVFRRTLNFFYFFMFSFLHVSVSFFPSSCFCFFFFHFFMFSFLLVFVSSGVFIADCICLLHCFFTVCVVTTSATDLRERFLLSGVFYLTLLSCFYQAFLWLAVLPWRFQGFPLRFETQTRPICLFESQSVWKKVLLGRFCLCVRGCYELLYYLALSGFELYISNTFIF